MEKYPLESENTKVVQNQARINKLDKKEVGELFEKRNIIYVKLEKKFRRNGTENQVKLSSMQGAECKKNWFILNSEN